MTVSEPLVSSADAREHIEYLRTHPQGGISMQQIADQAGVSLCVISETSRGSRVNRVTRLHEPTTTMRAYTSRAILGVRYSGVQTPRGASGGNIGTRRRLQGLFVLGFTAREMAAPLDVNRRVVWHYMTAVHVSATTRLKIKAMYEKLEHVDPIEHGVLPHVASRSKNMAAKRGWAPPHCWDEDTIDDPAAIPEHTGACGTMQGVRIHKTREIPYCDACRDARNRQRAEDKEEFHG